MEYPKHRLEMERKERVMELYREGYSIRQICRVVGLASPGYVHRIISLERKAGTV